jgi:hypothetical protein
LRNRIALIGKRWMFNAGDSLPDLVTTRQDAASTDPEPAGAVPDDCQRAHPVIRGGKFRLTGNFPDIYSLVRAADPDGIGLRIDLGCGFCKPPGVIGFDNLEGIATQVVNGANAPDVFMDLNCDPLPLRDSTCSEVRASHFLEHSALDHVISESYRVLKPDGHFNFAVPYANSADGIYPGHLILLTNLSKRKIVSLQCTLQ